MSKVILQFGAGNIGRSLVGFIFSELGYRIIFVEKRGEIVDLINKRGEYKIIYREKGNGTYLVKNISAISLDNKNEVINAIKEADFISTAVGAVNLSEVAPLLYEGLKERKDNINILICENLKKSSEFLKNEIIKHGELDFSKIGLIETSIAKMVPDVPENVKKDDPLLSWAEKYSIVYVNADGIKGEFVESPYLIPVKNFEAYYNRKIYISNLSHTLSSVIGYLNGYKYIAQGLADERIFKFVEGAVKESEKALKVKYPFMYKSDEDKNYSKDFLRRLKNPLLEDTVYRGGKDIQRKLSPGERLIGPVELYFNLFNDVPKNLVKGVAASFYFVAPGPDGKPYEKDVILQKKIAEEGIENILSEVTGIGHDSELGIAIIKEFKKGKDSFLSKNLE